MQTLQKSPRCQGSWHGTKRPRTFSVARAVPRSTRSISLFPNLAPTPTGSTGGQLSLHSQQERLATCLFPGLWYKWSNRSFYFIVPMISLVNSSQQNSSRSASEGWSWPGGSELAHLSWLHVSQRASETISISKLLCSGKLLFSSGEIS